MLPDAVHHHARHQRIRRVGNPFGELAPAAPLLFRRQRLPAEDLQESARHFLPGTLRIALALDPGVGCSAFAHRVGLRDHRRIALQHRDAVPHALDFLVLLLRAQILAFPVVFVSLKARIQA